MKAIMLWLRTWTWKYIGTLVMENKGGMMAMSLGRVAFVAILIQFFMLWHRAISAGTVVELPPGLMDVFYTVAGYTLGTKVVQLFKKGADDGQSPPPPPDAGAP
jgi:hypothetical protein